MTLVHLIITVWLAFALDRALCEIGSMASHEAFLHRRSRMIAVPFSVRRWLLSFGIRSVGVLALGLLSMLWPVREAYYLLSYLLFCDDKVARRERLDAWLVRVCPPYGEYLAAVNQARSCQGHHPAPPPPPSARSPGQAPSPP